MSSIRISRLLRKLGITGTLLSVLLLFLLARYVSLSLSIGLGTIGLVAAAALAITLFAWPETFVRGLVWVLMHTIYRMTISGRGNIPADRGALLVCNAVSFVDHALVLASLRRPVRFFMGREYYENRFLKPLARAVKAIPVDRNDNPKTIARALLEARAVIQSGGLVCIFAEGAITRTGNMLPFGRGFEFIMKGVDAPIVPMHLDRIWGSTFSFSNGSVGWNLPKELPYPITITFGKPLPATARASEVRLAVQDLSTKAFKLRGKSQKKLHIAFVDEVKKHPFQFCMADSLGVRLNYAKTLTAMLAFSYTLFPDKDGDIPDEKIGLLLPTSCGAVLANAAVLMAGKVPVNLNYTSSVETIRSCERQCEMRMVLTSRAFLEKLNMAPQPNMIFLEDVKAKVSKATQLRFLLAVLLLPARLIKKYFVRGDRTSIDDVATIIFSSGSTGEPKGVMLTHQNISSNIEAIYQIIGLTSSDVIMGILPFFHSFGYTANLWFPINGGAGVVYHPNPLDFSKVGELVHAYKATILMATPTFLAGYTRKCEPEQLRTLRLTVVGAEKLKQGVTEAFYNKFGATPLEGYGCTELSPIVSLCIPSYIHPKGKLVQVGNKPGTVGHPIPGVAAKIVHPETFERLAPGQEGLLLIKGPNVMKGYLNNPEKTAEVIKDGWYVTGDIATVDEDGFIAITDRLSRFSKIAGEMIPHIKIEEEIHDCLSAEGMVATVTAVPDDAKGERLVVLYTGAIDVDALWRKLNERSLPKLWIPKKECFYQIEALPLLGSGKLDLKKVKQLAVECACPAIRNA